MPHSSLVRPSTITSGYVSLGFSFKRVATILGGYAGLFAVVLAIGLTAPLQFANPALVQNAVAAPVQTGHALLTSEEVNTCSATADDGVTVYTGVFTPVQAAVDAATNGSIVKVAGRCVGVQRRGATTQTVTITKILTIRGGYSPTNWLESHPLTQPTTLDGLGLARVLATSADLTLAD